MEDQLFYLQLLTADLDAKFVEMHLFTYHYKKNQNSITTTKFNDKYLLDHFIIANQILKWVEPHQDKPFYPKFISILKSVYIGAYKYFLTFTSKQQKKYRHLFTDEIIALIKNPNI